MTKKSKPPFPVIDMKATGKRILFLRLEKGFSVEDLSDFFGFTTPVAIYHWQEGKTLPTVDHLYALSLVFGTPIEGILQRKAMHLYLSELPAGMKDGDFVEFFMLAPKGGKFVLLQIDLPFMVHRLPRPP